MCLINNTLVVVVVGRHRRATNIQYRKARRCKNIVKPETPADRRELRDLTLTEDRATSGPGDSLPSSSLAAAAAVVGLSVTLYYYYYYETNVRRWSDHMSHASHQTSMRYTPCVYKKTVLKTSGRYIIIIIIILYFIVLHSGTRARLAWLSSSLLTRLTFTWCSTYCCGI